MKSFFTHLILEPHNTVCTWNVIVYVYILGTFLLSSVLKFVGQGAVTPIHTILTAVTRVTMQLRVTGSLRFYPCGHRVAMY